MKIRLAILERDKSYLTRIVSAFSTKYSDKLEIYSFTDPEVDEMFYINGRGSSLQVVDLSSFDTSKLLETHRMFGGCSKLTTVYVGDGWDMSKVTTSYDMFAGCSSLVGGNGSTVAQLGAVDKSYACVDTPENPGYLTYKAAG